MDPGDAATGSWSGSLAGCRVAVTRERPGVLAELLTERGATVVHVPLIEIVDADDGGRALAEALADLTRVDWVLVTSAPGAERVAPFLADRAGGGEVRIGCVGTATAHRVSTLLGRSADLVPDDQRAAALAERFVEVHTGRPQRVVIAQADLAAGELADTLVAEGHEVTAVTAYRTAARTPTGAETDQLAELDAVVFASGSAAASWARALGDAAADLLPDHVVAIGPSTAATAEQNGLKVTRVAADHSLPGIVAVLESVWRARLSDSDGDDPWHDHPPTT